jgi:heme oxygenase
VTTTSGTTTEQPFSEAVKQASWEVHEHAEQSPFMQALLGGHLDAAGFAALVAQYHAVYVELERVGALLVDDPVAGPFIAPELLRVPALEADLLALLGPDWPAQAVATPATEAYRARLAEVASWPGGFVAHHYVRYMGDLSGGQVIRRVVERTYDIDTHGGTSFYVFDEIDDLRAFKARYRDRLDAVPWSAAERAAVIDEVVAAYDLNSAVLRSLT